MLVTYYVNNILFYNNCALFPVFNYYFDFNDKHLQSFLTNWTYYCNPISMYHSVLLFYRTYWKKYKISHICNVVQVQIQLNWRKNWYVCKLLIFCHLIQNLSGHYWLFIPDWFIRSRRALSSRIKWRISRNDDVAALWIASHFDYFGASQFGSFSS